MHYPSGGCISLKASFAPAAALASSGTYDGVTKFSSESAVSVHEMSVTDNAAPDSGSESKDYEV